MIAEAVQFCSQIDESFGWTRLTAALDLNVTRMSNIGHFHSADRLHDVGVKVRELTPKQIMSVPCTTCGAAIGEVCELHSGAPRTEPHRDRKLSAAEAVETKAGK